ncbi:unnamed protein product [Didymodactylos carnosus]|uniref:Major facilitator superfamily (MFS) profile domain-containing protein n=1 Tax=Didymodactylos carnosus TaxID=1234261 RepID=A0A814R332_9BILA|nr:unnamed protein product [Didymodactylos carnosus]CAF3891584.1 unnamed protein product [Didymodactylos carnosus]
MDTDSRPKCFRNLPHEFTCVLTISCAQLLTQASIGNVLAPLHIIGPAIGINDRNRLPWTCAAYSLTVGIFILITGRLGDIFGHKLLFILGFIWYGIFSLLTGMAAYIRNDIYFDIIRAFQGIGPATVLPNGIALLARAYPAGRRKSLVFAFFGATAPVGWSMGAVFASIFAQFVWWAWSQWVLAGACIILAILAYFIIPTELSPAVQPMGKIDIPGAVTGITGLVLIVYACNQGPVSGWDKLYVHLPLALGFIILGLFILIEIKTDEPIMPPSLWTAPGFPGVIVCVGLGWSSFGIWNYYFVQFVEVVRQKTPLLLCAMFSPTVPAGFVATILVSQLYHRVAGHYLLMISMVAFCTGNALIATAPVDQTYWLQTFVATLITPFGMDISFPAASLIVSNSMPIHQQGVAASMINTVINLSVSLGLGIAGTVESQINKNGDNVLKGYRGALYAGICLSGVGIIVALLFCRVPKPAVSMEKSIADEEQQVGQVNGPGTEGEGLEGELSK